MARARGGGERGGAGGVGRAAQGRAGGVGGSARARDQVSGLHTWGEAKVLPGAAGSGDASPPALARHLSLVAVY